MSIEFGIEVVFVRAIAMGIESEERCAGKMRAIVAGVVVCTPRSRSETAMPYCTFAVTAAAAFIVRLHVFVLEPPLEQLPDHTASRPLLTVKVTRVPVAKLAVPELPTATRKPAGLDETVSPERPLAV